MVDVYYIFVFFEQDYEILILLLFGIDVVYGYNNVFGVVIFFYNIGLGVVNDLLIVECVGVMIVKVLVVIGYDWIFVLIVVVVEDL